MDRQALCNGLGRPCVVDWAGPVQWICRPCAMDLQALCNVFAGPVQCICRPCALYLQALCSVFAGPAQARNGAVPSAEMKFATLAHFVIAPVAVWTAPVAIRINRS